MLYGGTSPRGRGDVTSDAAVLVPLGVASERLPLSPAQLGVVFCLGAITDLVWSPGRDASEHAFDRANTTKSQPDRYNAALRYTPGINLALILSLCDFCSP